MACLPSIVRRGLAALAAVAVLGWSAAPAAAGNGGIARVDRNGTAGETVHFAGDGDAAASTTLFNLRLDDRSAVGTYCVDLSTSVDHRAAYVEADWADYPEQRDFVHHADSVHWILRNSYPGVALERLREDAEIPGLDRAQAIGATQAAIWHYSNGVDLETGDSAGRNSAGVRALYDHLVAGAEQGEPEPAPALAINPDRLRGAATGPIGPLSLHTTSGLPVQVSVRGAEEARLVDLDGDPVTELAGGEQALLSVDPGMPEGTATVYAHAEEAVVDTGRLFVGKDGVQTQALIAAESSEVSLTVSTTVSWDAEPGPEEEPEPEAASGPTAPPSPSASARPSAEAEESPAPSAPVVVADDRRVERDLASTGTWAGTLVAAGVLLLIGGGIAMWVTRRRR
ncbi:TQXA domain-containing protein [Spinactinospora alkalitolerans]|uniref:TQXA domain-containing protein n=1 Tax=Spinactinospora alkalitolerans TaxID=687207 RepID=A0A852TPE3_9ACTN|nr:thioester domain-containing protein [Spinactinospora alkalitolerans]NYE45859.1 TQXA domain-containing protein [Spinactinospora alkalitolerans]